MSTFLTCMKNVGFLQTTVYSVRDCEDVTSDSNRKLDVIKVLEVTDCLFLKIDHFYAVKCQGVESNPRLPQQGLRLYSWSAHSTR